MMASQPARTFTAFASSMQLVLLYACSEAFFGSVVPWISRSRTYQPADTAFLALLMAVYAVAALLTAAVAQLIASRLDDDFALIVVCGAWALALGIQSARKLHGAALATLVVAAAIAATAFFRSRRKRFGWQSLVIFVVAAPAVAAVAGPLSAAAVIAAVIAAIAIVERVRLRLRPGAVIGATALTFACVTVLRPAEAPPPSPLRRARTNIILIVMDTVRADHTSVGGYARDTTPSLSRFSSHATNFLNAMSSADMTLATHASIFTGVYASSHGAHPDAGAPEAAGYASPLGTRWPTLAEFLQHAGYQTIGVAANTGYLTPCCGLTRGFQQYVVPSTPPFGIPRDASVRSLVRNVLIRFFPHWHAPSPYPAAAEVARSVGWELTDAAKRPAPFFLFVNLMDAHAPRKPPAEYRHRFGHTIDVPPVDEQSGRYDQLYVRHLPLTEEQRSRLRDDYDAGVAYADHGVGEILECLRGAQSFQGALVIVTSDHGESLGERDMVGHGTSVHAEQIRVPLLVHFPNQSEPSLSADVVSSVDLFPTILAAAGVRVPPVAAGRPLNVRARARAVLAESFSDVWLPDAPPSLRVQRAVIQNEWKLIDTAGKSRELYDVRHDRDELQDVAALHVDVAGALGRELDRLVADARARYRGSEARPLDRDAIERLRALGYLR